VSESRSRQRARGSQAARSLGHALSMTAPPGFIQISFVKPLPWTPMTTSAWLTSRICSRFDKSSICGTCSSTEGIARIAATRSSCAWGVSRRLAAACLEGERWQMSAAFVDGVAVEDAARTQPADVDDRSLVLLGWVPNAEVAHHALPDGRPPVGRGIDGAEDVCQRGNSESKPPAFQRWSQTLPDGRTAVHLVPLHRRWVMPVRSPAVEDDDLIKDVEVLRQRAVCDKSPGRVGLVSA
jgi:hypothetical protein